MAKYQDLKELFDANLMGPEPYEAIDWDEAEIMLAAHGLDSADQHVREALAIWWATRRKEVDAMAGERFIGGEIALA